MILQTLIVQSQIFKKITEVPMKSNAIEKYLIGFLCLHMALLPACNDNPNSAGDSAPEIPPIGTMVADISFFDDGNQSLQKSSSPQASHFLQAAVRVGIINLFLLAGSAIPVAATAAAFSEEPELQEDGKFHWIHNNPNLNIELDLTAQVNPGNIDWQMLVTRENPTELTNFRWYEGRNEIGLNTGYWIFYDDTQPEDDIQTVRVDWDYTDDDNKELTITNVKTGDSKYDSWIRYTVNGDDVTLMYYDSEEDVQVEISWNRSDRTGYLIDPAYENGSKSCWDSQRQNTDCP
jgi:hypothetical protein